MPSGQVIEFSFFFTIITSHKIDFAATEKLYYYYSTIFLFTSAEEIHPSLFNMSSTSSSKRVIQKHVVFDDDKSERSRHTIERDMPNIWAGIGLASCFWSSSLKSMNERGEYSGSDTLETVEILQSSNISCIGSGAFNHCKSLKSVQIAAGTVRSIGERAFACCSSLQSFHIPDSVTTVKWRAFACSSLQSVSIPHSVITIGDSAFYACSSLQSVHVPDSLITIGECAFSYCKSLQSIHIPDSVTSIGKCAFCGCSSLQSVHIPDSVITIERSAFDGCSSLQSVHIPDDVTTIRSYAFCDCSSLQSVHIPNSVTTIEWCAFKYCSSLKSVYIPHTVTTIDMRTFDYCTTLEKRQTHHPNYHKDTVTWLRQRFNNLPLHRACHHYGYNNTSSTSTLDNLCTLMQENKQALTATDAMGMTPLHILSCNPRATAETIQIIVEAEPSLLTLTDVTQSNPLQVYLMFRNLLQADEPIPSLQDLLEKGIEGEDLAIVSILGRNGQIDMSSQDENTGLSPFMSAAVTTACGLDAVYTLAMRNVETMIQK